MLAKPRPLQPEGNGFCVPQDSGRVREGCGIPCCNAPTEKSATGLERLDVWLHAGRGHQAYRCIQAQFARPVLGRPLLLEQRHDIAALVVAAHDYLPLRFERRRRKIDFATSSGQWHDLIAIDGKTSRRTHDTVGPKCRNPLPETTSEQDRLDAVDQRPQPALAWDTEMRRRESSQKIQIMLAPGDDVVEIVTRGDCGAGQKQESLREGIRDPPGFPVVVDLRGMLQGTAKRARGIAPSKIAS
jgi:hypothetical protein